MPKPLDAAFGFLAGGGSIDPGSSPTPESGTVVVAALAGAAAGTEVGGRGRMAELRYLPTHPPAVPVPSPDGLLNHLPNCGQRHNNRDESIDRAINQVVT